MARVEDVVVRETALRMISLDLEMGENGLRVDVGMVDNGGEILETRGGVRERMGGPQIELQKGVGEWNVCFRSGL